MAYLIRMPRAAWKRFNPSSLKLDESHWLVSRGISLYAPLGTATTNLITGDEPTTNSPTPVVSSLGTVSALNGTSQYIEYSAAAVVAAPFTMSIWGRPAISTAALMAMSLCTAGTTPRHYLMFDGATAGDPVTMASLNGATGTSVTTSSFRANAWNHAVGVVNSTASRAVYLNGQGKGTNTTSVTAFTPNRTLIGARINTTVGVFFSGNLAHALILPYALTDDEVFRLYQEQSENPYGFFVPRPARFILIPDGAGGGITLVLQKPLHSHSADNIGLVQSHVLALANSFHNHSVDSPILSQAYALTLAAAAHAHNTDNFSLIQANSLSIAETAHGHLSDSVVLLQAYILTLDDAGQSHSAESPTLSVAGALGVADAAQSHSADALSLSQANTLVLADAAHGHSAESVALTQAYLLAPSDSIHAQSGAALTLSTELNLSIFAALHGHTADSPGLTQAHSLVMDDALHSHSVASVSMGQGFALLVSNAAHNQSSDAPVVSVAFVLAVQAALHDQAVGSVALATQTTLVVADALHAHLAGSASYITLASGDRIFVVLREDRLFLVTTEDRLFGV
jgi:hypothetical protein